MTDHSLPAERALEDVPEVAAAIGELLSVIEVLGPMLRRAMATAAQRADDAGLRPELKAVETRLGVLIDIVDIVLAREEQNSWAARVTSKGGEGS